jgi:nucleotidyltransferase substrate binding protein (TIGR01987 family)
MTKKTDEPRWKYRFDNFKRAYELLEEAIALSKARALTPLEREGVIQRFEYTWELAWKVLYDYLTFSGIVLETVTPAATVRAAFAAQIIQDGKVWLAALDARNKMAHTYDMKVFEATVEQISDSYSAAFAQLIETLTRLEGDFI